MSSENDNIAVADATETVALPDPAAAEFVAPGRPNNVRATTHTADGPAFSSLEDEWCGVENGLAAAQGIIVGFSIMIFFGACVIALLRFWP